MGLSTHAHLAPFALRGSEFQDISTEYYEEREFPDEVFLSLGTKVLPEVTDDKQPAYEGPSPVVLEHRGWSCSYVIIENEALPAVTFTESSHKDFTGAIPSALITKGDYSIELINTSEYESVGYYDMLFVALTRGALEALKADFPELTADILEDHPFCQTL